MKTFKNINHTQILAIFGTVFLISLSSAQYKQTDTLNNAVKKARLEHIQLPDTCNINDQAKDSVKQKLNHIDASSCFEDGFLFKINSLSHI